MGCFVCQGKDCLYELKHLTVAFFSIEILNFDLTHIHLFWKDLCRADPKLFSAQWTLLLPSSDVLQHRWIVLLYLVAFANLIFLSSFSTCKFRSAVRLFSWQFILCSLFTGHMRLLWWVACSLIQTWRCSFYHCTYYILLAHYNVLGGYQASKVVLQ